MVVPLAMDSLRPAIKLRLDEGLTAPLLASGSVVSWEAVVMLPVGVRLAEAVSAKLRGVGLIWAPDQIVMSPLPLSWVSFKLLISNPEKPP